MKTNLPVLKIGILPLVTTLCAATATLLGIASAAQAGDTATLQQVGPDIIATGSGPIDLTGLTFTFTVPAGLAAEIFPPVGLIQTGPGTAPALDAYRGFTGPRQLGVGSPTFTSSGSGDAVDSIANINLLMRLGYYLRHSSQALLQSNWRGDRLWL